MDSETKVVYHGATVVDASTSYPPPYSQPPEPIKQGPGPSMQGPGPSMQAPVPNMQGQAPYMQSQPTAVIHNTPRVIVSRQFSPTASTMVCQSCRAEMTTKTEMKPSLKTHIFAATLCVCCCWCFVCIPYCMNSCKNVHHYCSNCNAYIGEYKA